MNRLSSTLSSATLSRSKSMWSLGFEDRNWSWSSAVSVEKAKLTQLLKTTQLEQLAKLQSKHQQECDLLDDIRNFGKQRSQIEKDYGQALQKLVLQYQKKDWPPSVEAEDADKRPVLSVWKSVLDATDKAAQARINGSENYKNNIYEAAKSCRAQKDVQLKRCQELLNTLHNEITETIKELTKAKKKYGELEQVASMAREKYQEVDDRLKKNQTSIFKSKAGLTKAFQKLQQKRDESSLNSTLARNEYILMLSAANSHQKRYYEVDMPEAMRVLDGDLFTKLQEYLQMLSQYELNVSKETEETYVKSLHEASKVSREYNTRCFLRENPIFEWGPRYEFESYGEDKNDGKLVEEQSGSDNSLNREARKWTYRVERESKQLERLQKMREGFEGLMKKYIEQPELSGDAGAQETEVRLEKCKQDIRRLETSRLQGEARLLLLRQTDVDVGSWIESARSQLAKEAVNSVTTPNRHTVRRKPSTPMTESVYKNGGDTFFNETDESFYDDDFYGDDFDETFENEVIDRDNLSIPSSDHSRNYPVTCTVSYAYQASRSDELTIAIGDKIEVIEDGDLDQWVKAKDSQGNLGYVPEYYLQFPPTSTPAHTQHQYALPPEEDASIVSDSASTSTSGTSSLTTTSSASGEVSRIISGAVSTPVNDRAICLAKAIYEYEACTDEELSFPEGAVINILSKDDSGVDDGWWKGELNGKVGVFPGLVVEEIGGELKNSTNLLDSPITDEPPDFRPPPPNECPPPPPGITITHRNTSWEGPMISPARHFHDLKVPAVKHERASSAPASPAYTNKPIRTAPAPPQRPRSLFRTEQT